MIDGSLLLYAFARGRERRPARSCFRPGSDWSTPLLTPFAPATWSDRSLLILTFFLPPFLTPPLHFRFCPPLLLILSPSLSLSLAFAFAFSFPAIFFSSIFVPSHTLFLFASSILFSRPASLFPLRF